KHLLSVVAPQMPRISVVERFVPAPTVLPSYVPRTIMALEHIRRMRGGAQSQLMKCSDGGTYVVKFQNNPQGIRILANELLAAHLASWLRLPVPQTAVVEVGLELINASENMVVELGRGRTPLHSGKCFGSRFVSDRTDAPLAALPAVWDFMPEEQLRKTANLTDFAGMLMFDQWTCNTDGRQVVYVRMEDSAGFRAFMIDNGFCFNAGEWSFPDGPLRGMYSRAAVYDAIQGFDAFEPWLDRLERGSDVVTLALAASQIPTEWFQSDRDGLARMLTRLDRRRNRVRELLWAAWKASRDCFRNWR
ncbi:MAG: HipA family kinase, partial [Candidatus Acidiferrales bacterium]